MRDQAPRRSRGNKSCEASRILRGLLFPFFHVIKRYGECAGIRQTEFVQLDKNRIVRIVSIIRRHTALKRIDLPIDTRAKISLAMRFSDYRITGF